METKATIVVLSHGIIPIPKSRDSDKFSNPKVPWLKYGDPWITIQWENVNFLFTFFCYDFFWSCNLWKLWVQLNLGNIIGYFIKTMAHLHELHKFLTPKNFRIHLRISFINPESRDWNIIPNVQTLHNRSSSNGKKITNFWCCPKRKWKLSNKISTYSKA